MKRDREKDQMFLELAECKAIRSKAIRLKVGALVVKNDVVLGVGVNHSPFTNKPCEYVIENGKKRGFADFIEIDDYIDAHGVGQLQTHEYVIHAEPTAIFDAGLDSVDGATLYVTHQPCIECAKLIYQCGIKRVVYRFPYRETNGVDFLNKVFVQVEQC